MKSKENEHKLKIQRKNPKNINIKKIQQEINITR